MSAALMAARRSGSGEPTRDAIPQIPRMGRNPTDAPSSVAARYEAVQRLLQHPPARCHHRAQIQAPRAVRDPLEIVGELRRHRGLVAPPHLCEPGEPGPDDESLPVRRQLVCELLEEDGAYRARPDEAHVAAKDVEELRELVELRRLQPFADRRELALRAAHELLAEVRAQARLGVGAQRAELQHREDTTAAPDALAPVEDRTAAHHQDDQRYRERERQ